MKLTGGLKRLALPQVALRGKSSDHLLGINESPWNTFKKVFSCDLSGTVSIVTFHSHPSQLRAIRTFKREGSKEILDKFRVIRHENVLLAREYYNYEDSVYVVFDDLPLTLDWVVECDYFPHDAEVSSILAQILTGLSYLHACGYDHRSLTCSNILLGTDGTIQIAGLECCAKSSPNQSESIEAVASITILLMQKYKKSNGAKGIDNIDRWPMDSKAFQFLQATDTVISIDELKEAS